MWIRSQDGKTLTNGVLSYTIVTTVKPGGAVVEYFDFDTRSMVKKEVGETLSYLMVFKNETIASPDYKGTVLGEYSTLTKALTMLDKIGNSMNDVVIDLLSDAELDKE